MNVQLKDVTPIIKAILEERDKIPRIIDQERYIPNPQPYHDGDCMRGGIRKALRIIEQAPVVAAMPRWISVEERLPKHGAMVLCNTRNYIEVLQWDEKAGLWFGMRTINVKGFVTHWMPLPELPKEESTC